MFLVFTLVLLIVAIGIVASVYSVFFPFMQNLWTVQQYYQAYYWAVSSLERASLVLRYREPWFVWSWGFFWLTWYGPLSDYTPEILSWDTQWFGWNISSRTTRIPSSGMWNTEFMLSYPWWDSVDYNQLGYMYLEQFILSYDATTDVDKYYTWWSLVSFFSDTTPIYWRFRLPPKVFDQFGWVSSAFLCDTSLGADCDPDGDGNFDDTIVSWSLEWLYQWQWFKIFPTVSVFYHSGMQIDTYKDNAFRESLFASNSDVEFLAFSPFTNWSHLTKHNVVSAFADSIAPTSFSTLFASSDYTWLLLSFGAVSLFRSLGWAIYPYIEYQFTFPQEIADRFYTISWNGRVGEYDVQIILKKPTVQGTVGGDFTVIF